MNKLTVLENNNERVLTTKQLAEVYETTDKNISNNFNNNKDRFLEGKHYYKLEGEYLKKFLHSYDLGLQNSNKIRSLYLWTEKGASRMCKILDTDRAWERFDELENCYFRVKENSNNPIGLLESMQNKLKEQEERISKLESTNELIRKALNTGSKKEVKKLLPKNMGDVEKVQLLIFANLDRYTTYIKDGKRIMDRKPINDDCKRLFGLTPCLVKKALDYIEGVESSSKVFSIEDKSFRACVVDL